MRTLTLDMSANTGSLNADKNPAAYGFGSSMKHVYVEVDVDGTWGCANLMTNLFSYNDERSKVSRMLDVSS